MNPWWAKAIVLLGTLAVLLIPASLHRGEGAKVALSRKGPLERGMLALTSIGFLLPLVWVATPVLSFADYSLRPIPLFAGILWLAIGLWFLHRSHADLGRNWSITLELREGHQLVTHGIYRRVRHPMYLALLLYATGQALVLPNWVAGPSYLVAIVLLFTLRVDREERMMLEEFGKEYETYRARTNRLFPSIWWKTSYEIIAAHAGCTRNREALAKAETCGCFYCCSVFSPREIEDWVDPASDDMQAGNTALCPRCGIDSVIPLQPGMNVGFLRRMRAHWF